MKINPSSTQKFRDHIIKSSENGNYMMHILLHKTTFPIKIADQVFPPQKEYLMSNHINKIYTFRNKKIADIGTGSGIEAIIAARLGAKHVDAIDINPLAVKCANENVHQNKVAHIISTFSSDLFTKIKKSRKYHLILANLPFVDFDGGNTLIDCALYDNNLTTHKKFLKQAKKHLTHGGLIILPHANLQSGKTARPNQDFTLLEKIIAKAGYRFKAIAEKPFRTEYKWRLYQLTVQ